MLKFITLLAASASHKQQQTSYRWRQTHPTACRDSISCCFCSGENRAKTVPRTTTFICKQITPLFITTMTTTMIFHQHLQHQARSRTIFFRRQSVHRWHSHKHILADCHYLPPHSIYHPFDSTTSYSLVSLCKQLACNCHDLMQHEPGMLNIA